MNQPATRRIKFILRDLRSIFGLFLAAALAVFLSYQPAEAARPDPDQAQLLRVIDGDTLKIRLAGRDENIRLIGIDTPEREANEKALRDSKRSQTDIRVIVSQGLAAKAHLESLIPANATLRIEFDVERHDRYGRLLGYVYRTDGLMLNQTMVRDGYAYTMTVPPNVKYEQLFRAEFKAARHDKRGLWKDNG
ncbi:MAG: thermonuclease family protein [Oligoflexia bacterium]|nr:thermonuclease family protein [Oligoflexia bacterium]